LVVSSRRRISLTMILQAPRCGSNAPFGGRFPAHRMLQHRAVHHPGSFLVGLFSISSPSFAHSSAIWRITSRRLSIRRSGRSALTSSSSRREIDLSVRWPTTRNIAKTAVYKFPTAIEAQRLYVTMQADYGNIANLPTSSRRANIALQFRSPGPAASAFAAPGIPPSA